MKISDISLSCRRQLAVSAASHWQEVAYQCEIDPDTIKDSHRGRCSGVEYSQDFFNKLAAEGRTMEELEHAFGQLKLRAFICEKNGFRQWEDTAPSTAPGPTKNLCISSDLHAKGPGNKIPYVKGTDEITENDDSTCTICLSYVKRCLLRPCNHLCLCIKCANKLLDNQPSQCPICRVKIVDVIKAFA